jgi:uncharacterized membrane protein
MLELNHTEEQSRDGTILYWSSIALVATVWISALLFGLYIFAFYVAALTDGDLSSWNRGLPGLYEEDKPAATMGIGLHFATGAIILILGSIQLLKGVRNRYPKVHRWIGRIYVSASILTALGGLIFIAVNGTIGGTVMDIGFTLYGLLMLLAAIETIRHAKAGRLEKHNAWAWRLYALAIGSWLYRMDYGFWFILADGAGHTRGFQGLFDQIMAFFFYIPNLLVVEVFLRARNMASSSKINIFSSILLLLATVFLLIGTYFFTVHQWGPAIVGWLTT